MAIAISEDLYLSKRKIQLKKLVDEDTLNSTLEQKLEKTIKELTLSSVAVTTATTKQIGSYTITEAGTYLISGNIPLNYYGQEGRSMHVQLKKNGAEIWLKQ